MKKTICLILLSIFLILGFGSEKVLALKNNGKSSLNGIDFSVPLNSKEQKIVMDYYNNPSNQKILQKKIKKQVNGERKRLAKKGNKGIKRFRLAGNNSKKKGKDTAIGTAGDIMIKYNYRKGKFYFFIPGHAAIVSTNPKWTIESFPNSKPKRDGVRRYRNNWGHESRNTIATYVKSASQRKCIKAAKYAKAQVGKRYNIIFPNKTTVKKFYCSQLVWRAWINQGIDLDCPNLGEYDPVLPIELLRSKRTQPYYVN